MKEYRREKRKEKKRKGKDDSEEEIDPEMAAIMGFGGFGSQKKTKL